MSTQSWRAYGGTQHYEVNNNLSVNNLVVGNLTLKNQYFGFLDINGTFSVSGLTTLNNNLIVNGEQDTYGNFNVYGQAAFYNDVSFAKSLAIAGNIVVNGTVEALSTFIMYSDLQVAGNIYVTNNVLAMGYNFSSNPQNDNPIYSGALVCNAYHEGAFMGINTPYTTGVLPGATLDVFSDSSNNLLTTSALNVYATGAKTQSIVSSNRFHQGAIIYTDPSQCSLHWFSDTSLVSYLNTCETNTDVSYVVYPYVTDASANCGDATLVYKKGGEIALTVSENVAIASHMSVGSRLLEGDMMEMGDVFVHDGTTGHTAFQETVTVVSDMSLSFFPRYYTTDASAVPGYNAQSALTLVAGDASGNDHTALSMMTQTGLGTRAVGGSYIYDAGRAMGGSGLILDASGDWIPTVMTVQNKSLQNTQPAYCRSVTGFNTYAPPLDNYGVVINGPTHLTNGEITVVADVSFEIKRLVASAREPTAVLATGVPISYDSNLNYFGFSVLTSSDAGQNWTSYVMPPHAIGSNLSPRNYNYIHAATVYDSMSALFALNYGGYVFVSTDRLTTWNPLVLQYANGHGFTNGVKAMTVLDADISSNLVVLLDVSNTLQGNTGYNLGYIFLDASHSLTRSLLMGPQGLTHPNFHLQEASGDEMMDIAFSYTSFPTHMNAAYAVDGYDTSYVFVAGSGISKYTVTSVGPGYGISSTPASTWHLNGSYTYRAMKTYKTYTTTVDGTFLNRTDPLFSVFVGDGIITTTSDAGRTFTDVSAGLYGMVFQDVVIYDVSRAVVTGVDSVGGGVIMVTYNAGRTWVTPYNALNAGGTMNLLLSPDASRNLVSIAQTGTDNFLVARVDVNYDLLGNTGYSRFCHCHVPTLFHRSATVMDMCGSLWVSGSATIEDNMTVGGVITCPVTTIQSDYRLKTGVVPLCDVSGSVVDALNPVQYTNMNTGIQDVGFLAHEVAEQFPFLVHGDKDAPESYQSLNYTGLIGILVKEIQELKRRVAVLETSGP